MLQEAEYITTWCTNFFCKKHKVVLNLPSRLHIGEEMHGPDIHGFIPQAFITLELRCIECGNGLFERK